jgi:hypothetical protein
MKNYSELTVNDKINLKQRFIDINGKRAHLNKPNQLKTLNELQIHTILN